MSEISETGDAAEAARKGTEAQAARLEDRLRGASEATAERSAVAATDAGAGSSLAEALKKVREIAARTAAKVVRQR